MCSYHHAKDWNESQDVYKAMDDGERAWFDGFTMALLFVQAYNDKEGGSQTLVTHLPNERWDGNNQEWIRYEQDEFEKRVEAVINFLDDGGIMAFRFKTEEVKLGGGETYHQRTIEIGGSEGFFGMPEWG